MHYVNLNITFETNPIGNIFNDNLIITKSLIDKLDSQK